MKPGPRAVLEAVTKGDLEWVKILVERGASIKKKINPGGDTALHISIAKGYDSITKFLVAKGVNVNALNKSRQSGLYLAALGGNVEIAALLIDKGADLEHKAGILGYTPLVASVVRNHLSMVEFLVSRGADVNAEINEKETGLLFAAYHGFVEIVDVLIQNGADLKHKNEEGMDSLMQSVLENHLSTAKLLVAYGANVNTSNNYNASALFVAAENGYVEIAELLIQREAWLEQKEQEFGRNPLIQSVIFNHPSMVQLLLRHGANVNATDNNHQSALMFAAVNGHLQVAELLIQNGADLKQKDEDGNNSLMLSVMNNKLDMVKLLLEDGTANVNIVNYYGQSPLEIAANQVKNDEIVRLLNIPRRNPDVRLYFLSLFIT